MFALIPSRDPDERLRSIVTSLLERGEYNIIIVNYDADDRNADVFAALLALDPERMTVIRHEGAAGKGSALRTGFRYIKDIAGENDGVVCVSAVGRNTAEDVDAVTAAWNSSPAALVLGSYRYAGKLPLGKRMSTGFTRSIFAVTSGVRVHNPYTGLRAFSVEYLDGFIKEKGSRSDYELNLLLHAAKHNVKIIEVPIEVDNIEGNRTGERRSPKDTWLIYKTIGVFMLSSFSSFVVDYTLLLALAGIFHRLRSVVEISPGEFRLPMFGRLVDTHLLALVIARAVSSFVNYLLNRRIVFKSKSWGNIFRYYAVILSLLAANYLLLSLVSNANGLPLWIAQLVVQAVLYPFSFILQRKFVFPAREHGVEKRDL